MIHKPNKIIYLVLCFCFIFQQTGLAQGVAELNLASHLGALHSSLTQDKFRPLHLRYLGYDNQANSFKLLLDQGDQKNLKEKELENLTQKLLEYFFIGVTLPNSSFWVNLRPDSPQNIIDDYLAQTDVGRILLEADLQLKKDTANLTSPQTPEGKRYWDSLYKKAEELFGSENITIPTLVRPWIVPNEIILREAGDNAYIYKATLKVMLEEDYLRGTRDERRGTTTDYSFKDPRLKALNEYSAQLLNELIIPKLTKEVNTSKRYAHLRQVYFSLILSQWFKPQFYGKGGLYSWLIDKKDLTNLTSTQPWNKTTYFKQYQASFQKGEYNLKIPVLTPTGQSIRTYFSGGIALQTRAAASSIKGKSAVDIATVLSSPDLINLALISASAVGDLPSAASPLITNRRGFFRVTLGGTIAASKELQPALAAAVGPSKNKNNQAPSEEQIITLLGELEPSYLKNKKLLEWLKKRFFLRIDFTQLQEEKLSITDDSSKDIFLQKVMQRVRDWINANPKERKELFKLFVPNGEEIFKLLVQENMPELIENICLFITQLDYIRLRLLGFNVVVSEAPAHIFPLIPEGDNQYLWIDSSRGVFGRINLRDYYDEEGEYWVLKPKHRRPIPISEELYKVLMDHKRKKIINLNTLSEKEKDEVLYFWYFYLQPHDDQSATFATYNTKGRALSQLGRLEEAIKEAYPEALRLNPNYAEAHNNLGVALFRSDRLEEAIEEYEEALRLNPNYAEAHNNLGVALFRSGKVPEAIKEYQEALRLNPNYAKAHYNRGNALFELGKFEEAEKAYNETINLNPNYAEAFYGLGKVYFKLAQGNNKSSFMNKAVQEWVKAVNLRPDLFNLLPPEVSPEVKEAVRSKASVSISSLSKKSSSPLNVKENSENAAVSSELGGIDFRSLPIINQPVVLPPLIGFDSISPASSSPINLDERRKEIEKMLEGGFIPSSAKIKEYLQAYLQQEDAVRGISRALSCIARIFRLEEEYTMPTDNKLKELLVMLES